jgi:hypothetical protein
MKTEQIMEQCKDHLKNQSEQEQVAIHKRYAMEELNLPEEEAQSFSLEMLQPFPDSSHLKYLNPEMWVLFYLWYCGNCLCPGFLNGSHSEE